MQDDEFTLRLMSDIDPELLDLVQNKVNSFLKWDLVKFFDDNPGTVDTADRIARCIGHAPTAVTPELDELVRAGLLARDERAEPHLYTLAQDPHARDVIHKFLRACDDRHFRIKAVYHVVRASRLRGEKRWANA